MSTDFIRYRRALQPGSTASADLSMVYYIIWDAPELVDSVHDLSFFLNTAGWRRETRRHLFQRAKIPFLFIYLAFYRLYLIFILCVLTVKGESQLLRYIRMCFEKHIPPDEHMHNKAGLLFREYMLVGGMPKAVSKYLESGKSFHAADVEKRDILVTYRNDIGKIASSYRTKVLSVFDQIPAFLSQHEKRVRLKSIEGGEGIDYEETFFWLSDSMIVNECFNSTDPNVGLSLNEDRTYIKCYLCDTGLLISHTFDESQLAEENLYLKILKNRLSVNKGMFFENAVAQCLTAGGHKLYYYNHYNETLHRNDMEIDFLISEGSKISGKLNAIEVKSSKNYTTTSLSAFLNRYGRKRIKNAYVIHPKSYQEANGIIYLPAYMSFCL